MKKIAILTSKFPVLSETFVGNEMRAMLAHGHSVLPIAMSHSFDTGQLMDESLLEDVKFLCDATRSVPFTTLIKLGFGLFRCLPFVFKQKGLGKKTLYWNGLRLAHILKKESIHHIHAHFAHATAAHAIVAAKMANIPVSFVGHGSDIYVDPIDLSEKLAYSDFAVAVCEQMLEDFSKLVDSKKIKHINCGIDPELFKPRKIDDKSNRRFLFVGRLSETKGIDQILNALANISPEVRPSIDIVGDGVLRDNLTSLTVSLKLEKFVNFLGAKESNWIIQHAPNYLAFVAPFKPAENGAKDTGPLVVKEAMAMGLPVISTRFMGIKEMVTEETGILVEVNDISALSEAINRIYQMSETSLYLMGQAGRKRLLSHYTVAKQAQELSKWVEAT